MGKLHDPAAVAAAIHCPVPAVTANLELILTAMQGAGVLETNSAIGMLATVAVETAWKFQPIHEFGNAAYFAKYDGRADLGNVQAGDGYKFRGRGFIQITGRGNYVQYGRLLGIDLLGNPEDACNPQIAARVAASYWQTHGIQLACHVADWQRVRRAVNGGLNGWNDFIGCVNRLIPLA